MEDLSGTVFPGDPITALVPSSMEGGNMASDNKLAMTAPGSQPVTPLPPAKMQADPKITTSNSTQIQPGTNGKPRVRTTWSPPEPSWGKTTTPDVARTPES